MKLGKNSSKWISLSVIAVLLISFSFLVVATSSIKITTATTENSINVNVSAFEMAFGALLISMQAAGTAIQHFGGFENKRVI